MKFPGECVELLDRMTREGDTETMSLGEALKACRSSRVHIWEDSGLRQERKVFKVRMCLKTPRDSQDTSQLRRSE